MKKILSLAWKCSPYTAIFLYVISFVLGGVSPAITFFEMQMIDTVTERLMVSHEWGAVILFLVILGFLYAAGHVLPPVQLFLQERCSLKLNEEVKRSLFEKINGIDFRNLEDPEFRDKWNRITAKADERIPELLNATTGLVSVVVSIGGIFIYVFWMSPSIMVIYLLEVMVLFFISKKAATAMFRLNKQFSTSERRVLYLNGITNSKEYAAERKLFQYTPFVNEKRIGFMKKQREAQRKFDFRFALYSSGIDVLGYMATLLIMIAMFPQLKGQQITIGFFLAFSRATLTVNNMMQNRVKALLDVMMQQRLYWGEYGDLIRMEETESADGFGGGQNIDQIDTIEFRNVYFSYPNGTEVLHNTSFCMEKGYHYSLVGENGAGKSTIIKLMLGLYKVTGGQILVNGINIERLSKHQLKKMYAVVFQDFVRYAITLSENIILDGEEDRERYDKVLKYVGLDTVEEKLENGSDTLLGKIEKDGKDLSGGEWQKIAIARALYREADFVIFDEPTASLDPVAESKLYHQYYQMMKGRTTVFISHRLASATLSDKILVLDNKHICESGTHEELMKSKGVYYKLFMAQRKWYWGDSEYEKE